MLVLWVLPALLVAGTGVAQAAVQLQWTLDLPMRRPAWEHTSRTLRDWGHPWMVQGELLVIGCEHNGAVLAVDLDSGQQQWRFYTGAPVRLEPVGDGKRIYVTSDDGYLYALDGQGRLLWKFRGGPAKRKVIGHERLISAWPGAAVAVNRGKVFFVAGHWPIDGVYVHALDAATGRVLWTNSAADYRPSGLAQVKDDRLFVYGYGGGGAYDARTGRALADKPPQVVLPPQATLPEGLELDGDVLDARMHEERLIVVTTAGTLYCFADRPTARSEAPSTEPAPQTETEDTEPQVNSQADELLKRTGVQEGYALVLGLRDGALVEGLLRGSQLRVVAVDSDAGKVDAIRRRLDQAGLFDDHRLQIYEGDPADFGLPPYIASLITSETTLKLTDALRESLHPYGGTFAVFDGGKLTTYQRRGGVPGAGQWTHELADEANALASSETVVRAPLGILWYEGPAGDARFYYDGHVDHQSGHGVSPLPPGAEIVEGRMILQGPGRLGAFDIYTGRLLWETAVPEVYGFGGPGGGVGIHSMKHREPWRYGPAMQAELPATHHSRVTGLNFTCTSDAVYVCAGRELLCFDLEDGSRRSAWKAPLTEAEKDNLCWGIVRSSGDYLVATAFGPQELVDAQCGHDGNGGEWSKDRMPMRYLLVLDRASGKLLWSRKAQLGFLNRGMAIGRGTVFCLDTIARSTLEKFREAGRRLPAAKPTLYALELASGKVKWQFEPEVLVYNLTYASNRDLLLVPCRNLITWDRGRWVAPEKLGRSTPGKMWGLRGSDGRVLWEATGAAYYEPHLVIGDVFFDRNCFSYDLSTGRRNERPDPLTGVSVPWHFRKGGCNHLVGCPTLLTWRTGFYDLAGGSGSMPLEGMNCGCTATMLPAGGVLNVPNFGTHHKRSRMTALALVHQPDNRLWTQYYSSREKLALEPAAIRRAGYNFGAPGDRRAEDGTLWLSITPRKSESLTLLPKEAGWFRFEPAPGETARDSWIAPFGVEGVAEIHISLLASSDKRAVAEDDQVRRYDLRLHFAEPAEIKPGQRVFSVAVEGRPVIANLDIVRAAGGVQKPLVRELKHVEVQGALDISFSASRGKPLVCGVELIAR